MIKKRLFSFLLPACFGLCLFLCIRTAQGNTQDTPYAYWQAHTLRFIVEELGVVILASYPVFWLMYGWFRLCRRRGWPWWVEYGQMLVGAPLCCLLVILFARWMQGRTLDPYDLPVPMVISTLLTEFSYAFLRYWMLLRQNERQQLQLEKVKNDQLETELKYLKAQYHPHFLFNVLNTVYFQIDEQNEQPRQTLEKLAALLRYQLYNDGGKVKLSTEIEHLKLYIDLWRMRCSERLRLNLHFDDALGEQEVYPLLFIPLVENAFKYVGGKFRIVLDMRPVDGKLHLFLQNSVPPLSPESSEPCLPRRKPGIGIENLRRRLELLYPGSHSLNFRKQQDNFIVNLTIPL